MPNEIEDGSKQFCNGNCQWAFNHHNKVPELKAGFYTHIHDDNEEGESCTVYVEDPTVNEYGKVEFQYLLANGLAYAQDYPSTFQPATGAQIRNHALDVQGIVYEQIQIHTDKMKQLIGMIKPYKAVASGEPHVIKTEPPRLRGGFRLEE